MQNNFTIEAQKHWPDETSVSQCHGQQLPNLLVEVSPRLTRNDKHRCDSTRLFIIRGLRNEKARTHFLHRLLASRVTIRGSPPREKLICDPSKQSMARDLFRFPFAHLFTMFERWWLIEKSVSRCIASLVNRAFAVL